MNTRTTQTNEEWFSNDFLQNTKFQVSKEREKKHEFKREMEFAVMELKLKQRERKKNEMSI